MSKAPRGREFAMFARYNDGFEKYYYGYDESWCMADIAEDSKKHDGVELYTGVCDELYEGGEWCPEEEKDYSINAK